MRRRTVTFAFHKMDEVTARRDAWQTRACMRLLGEYVHVDVRFEDGIATSINNGETVSYQRRGLLNPCKKLLALSVSEAEYAAMRAFATNAHRTGVGFNTSGFYRCAIPMMWRRCDDRQYFCSEYALRLLHVGGRLLDIDAGKMHPTLLMHTLAPHCSLTANTDALKSMKISMNSLLAPGRGGGGYSRI